MIFRHFGDEDFREQMTANGICLLDADFCAIRLNRILADGEWHECEEIRKQMTANRISDRVLEQVRKALGVETKSLQGKFYWRLP